MSRAELKELRCSSCGEYMGLTFASWSQAAFCSTSCTGQPRLRKSEARDSYVCELRASGMSLDEIAAVEELGLRDKRAVRAIIESF